MATLVIRNVEDDLHQYLKAQAVAHRHSMEEEVRLLLRQAVSAAPADSAPQGFGAAMRAIFEPLGGIELPAPDRAPPRAPPDFSGPEWDPAA